MSLRIIFGIICIFSLNVLKANAETGLNHFETKVVIEGGTVSCYYHALSPRRIFNVEYNVHDVRKGRVEGIGFTLKVNNTLVIEIDSKTSHNYDDESLKGGTYEMCLDNSRDSRRKHVILYISFYKFIEYETLVAEFQESPEDIQTEFFFKTMESIESHIHDMHHMAQVSRTLEAIDLEIAQSVTRYVSFWSAVNCFIIMFAAAFQVYFIRRLFDSEATGRTRFLYWLLE